MEQISIELEEVTVVAFGLPKKTETETGAAQQEDGLLAPLPDDEADDSAEFIFVTVEKMPEFPGGEVALMKYISDNLHYPPMATERGAEGQVHCKFTIREDGAVGNVKVTQSVDPLLDDEAIRVIYSMPRWIPGEQRGQKVAVEYSVPVTFRIVK